jgi:hypothetical protein
MDADNASPDPLPVLPKQSSPQKRVAIMLTACVILYGVAAYVVSTDAKLNSYLFHGKLSIGAEDTGLGARMYKNNCAQALISCLLESLFAPSSIV